MLQHLIELSLEKSSEKRREVLQQVSILFSAGAENYSRRETLLFGEIFVRLLDQVPVEDRVALSKCVAQIDQTPRDVAVKLANDVDAVAAPVLEFSTALNDDDLRHVAAERGQGHLLAISKRAALSEALTDIIVERGETEVLASVAANTGAHFSENGFATLAERASATDNLGEILSKRSDLPTDVVAKIMPMLDDASRQRMLLLVEQDGGKVHEIFSRAQEELEAARKYINRDRLDIRYVIDDIREGKRSLEDCLDQTIREKRVADLVHLIAEFSGMPIPEVANVFHKVDSTGIATVCRLLDMPDDLYLSLSRLRCEKLKLAQSHAGSFGNEYRALDKPTAERAVRFHKVRSAVTR